MTYKVVDIPEDLVETVNEWRQKLIESVAEYDDVLLEKFFEDPDSIIRGRNAYGNTQGCY